MSKNFSTDENNNIRDVSFEKLYKIRYFVIISEGKYFL